MELSINVVEDGKQKLIRLSGEIDAYTAPQLKDTLQALADESGISIRVDMEFVTYMDSTGLGVFIGALKSAKKNDSKLEFVNLSDRVYRVFQITGLDEIMDLNRISKVERASE